MQTYKVGILGATGMVGQQYISLLEGHPYFEISYLAASERSAQKTYEESVKDRWHMNSPIPEKVKGLTVQIIDNIDEALKHCSFVFSALEASAALHYEELYAKAGIPVISNASTHRKSDDVAMIIPEINPQHLEIIPHQKKRRGFERGFIVTKPNCSIQSYLTPLFALHKEFSLKHVIVSTMQSISGAGYPGVSSFNILDNIIPYIPGEEEKSESEPLKILGSIRNGAIINNSEVLFSAHCNRVPVVDGHLACVSVSFNTKPSHEDILNVWNNFKGEPQKLKLPSSPENPIIYQKEKNRPQPRLDRNKGKGMLAVVGRLRQCKVFDYRFACLSHNTIRGAAGGAILMAELIKEKGLLL